EARQRPPGRRGRTRRPPAEDLRVWEQRDAEVAPDEAPARGADDELQRAADLDASQQLLRPLGLAAVRERDDHVEPLPEQAAELVLGLGQPAGRERRPLRVEGEALGLRQ